LMEASGSAWLHSESDAEAVIRAFEKFGVVVIEEDGSMGVGVRLKFTRQDVKQINRLESEGGIVRSDDAPEIVVVMDDRTALYDASGRSDGIPRSGRSH
jgi:hypothetical protein